MPQLDTTYLISQFFWLAVCFTLFYLSIRFLVIPKLRNIIETRDHVKTNNLTKAHMLELQLKEMKAEDHQKSQEVSNLIESLKAESDKKFAAFSKKHLDALKSMIAADISAMEKDIADLKEKALSTPDVEKYIVDAAKSIIFRITKNEVKSL